MINPSFFIETLRKSGIEFYTGVPDSLLKSVCAYLTDHTDPPSHIIAVNEGAAVGLAAGYHLATGKIPLVYMQNSGLGNATNPLLSLTDNEVYNLPLLLLIGWRGEPDKKDEPQHIKQGKVTIPLLDAM
jgi:phosphonopyruvate decarboxylase